MQNNIHYKFISSPIIDILRESVDACSVLGDGIESQPLCEYILQTTFLKMTGASEQKMKCLCWEMATMDYRYRYDYLSNKNHGECSSYKDKNDIYKDLIKQIKNLDPAFTPDVFFTNKQDIINNSKEEIIQLLDNSVIKTWVFRGILMSKNNSPHDYIKETQLKLDDKNMFESSLINFYEEVVYDHRNRCAHNLKSYQNNLPSLKTLEKDSFVYENYFYRYLLLVILDTVFIKLYGKYLDSLNNVPA